MKRYPTVDGQALATNVTFAQFECPSVCGCEAFAIGNNPLSPDAVHPLELTGAVKLAVPLNKLVFFYNPDPGWIVQEVMHIIMIVYIMLIIGLCRYGL